MNRPIRHGTILLAAGAFVAAGGITTQQPAWAKKQPRYETRTSRTAPTTPEGESCVARCESTRNTCDERVAGENRRCYTKAEKRTDDIYNSLNKQYERDYAEWERDYNRCNDKAGANIDAFQKCQSMLGQAPHRPNRRRILQKQAARLGCRSANMCVIEYNQCFQGCGGTIESRTVCVEHCDSGIAQKIEKKTRKGKIFDAERPIPPGQALVYIYRVPNKNGKLYKIPVEANGTRLVKLRPKKVYPHFVPAGTVVYSSKYKPGISLPGRALEAGETYFLRVKAKAPLRGGQKLEELTFVPEEVAVVEMYKMKVIDK